MNPALTFPRPIVRKFLNNISTSITKIIFPISTSSQSVKSTSSNTKNSDKIRIQDVELQKMSDPGKCLSIHQPYASLLVAGIKKYIFFIFVDILKQLLITAICLDIKVVLRYCSHRGRLWIASTVKEPSHDEIKTT